MIKGSAGAMKKKKLTKAQQKLLDHWTNKEHLKKTFGSWSKSYNVFWNKDYTIEASWLAGKPVGGN